MIEVAALGELLIDFAEKSTDADGYPTMAAHAGGAPANFLAALNHFGHPGALLGKVGEDAFGKMLLKTLENAGIETSGIVEDPSVFTTLAFVTFDKSGDRSFSFARKPGADTCLRFDEVKTDLIDEAKVFHFGTLSLTNEPMRSTTKACVAYAKAAGKLITCAINQPADVTAENIEMKNSYAEFDVIYEGTPYMRLSLSVGGMHNVYNALCCAAVCIMPCIRSSVHAPSLTRS